MELRQGKLNSTKNMCGLRFHTAILVLYIRLRYISLKFCRHSTVQVNADDMNRDTLAYVYGIMNEKYTKDSMYRCNVMLILMIVIIV